MTIGLVPSTPFVHNLTLITESIANSWRANMAKALDGVGGSDGIPSQPATRLLVGGAGLGLVDDAVLTYNSRSLTRVQTSPLVNLTSGDVGVYEVDVDNVEQAYQALERMPNGATLDLVRVYVMRGASAPLPGTSRIAATLFKRNVTTGADTTIVASTEDPTTVLASYEAYHSFTLTPGATETVDNTRYIYFVRYSGEAGSNATVMTVSPCAIDITVTSQDEAP